MYIFARKQVFTHGMKMRGGKKERKEVARINGEGESVRVRE